MADSTDLNGQSIIRSIMSDISEPRCHGEIHATCKGERSDYGSLHALELISEDLCLHLSLLFKPQLSCFTLILQE